MALGDAAEYYIHNDMGRAITRTEALEVLAKAEAAGLVLHPSNSKNAVFICACCAVAAES